ncbi:hypothetical protein BD311DRAFT_33234 [Dichomitus squalens]|uniref:Uncharacterized protein n=1 Tax=Dichomitus squalens TaxID=114155 RepID=A0A4Q9MWM4_9APHY|nr:hypothetical protein BD311DRAFT_33234 [Dichomitus squalens]
MQRTSREGCEEDISFNFRFDLYYHRSRLPSTLLHFPVAMFILSFVFAGIFMLGVLEPRFTMTLLSHTMPQAELLLANAPHRCRRLASQYLLAQVPWTLQDPDPNPLVLPDPGVDTSHVARMTSPMIRATCGSPRTGSLTTMVMFSIGRSLPPHSAVFACSAVRSGPRKQSARPSNDRKRLPPHSGVLRQR